MLAVSHFHHTPKSGNTPEECKRLNAIAFTAAHESERSWERSISLSHQWHVVSRMHCQPLSITPKTHTYSCIICSTHRVHEAHTTTRQTMADRKRKIFFLGSISAPSSVAVYLWFGVIWSCRIRRSTCPAAIHPANQLASPELNSAVMREMSKLEK